MRIPIYAQSTFSWQGVLEMKGAKFRKRVGVGRGSSGLVREGEWTRFWTGRELSSERGEAGPRVDVS